MATKLLLPILNRNATLFKGPTWYLSENVSVETISPEDFGLILSSATEEYQALVLAKSKCIRIGQVDPVFSPDIARTEGSKIAFLLNYFKRSQPVALSFAVQITKKRKNRFDRIINLPVPSDAHLQRHHNYRVRDNIARETISEFYKVVTKVHDKNPSILLTLDRFNAALFRVQPYDKIIDITISLESLIEGTTELRNRFSLYNAWAAEPDAQKRKDCYDLLISLYDARSAIVHGSGMSPKRHKKTIDPILEKWDEIIKIAEKSLGYHLLYVYKNNLEKWYEHQKNLALGIEQRIV
jgi:hypothetical protein